MDTTIPPTMPAVVFRQGRGLVLEELPVPSVDPDGVLVQVAHTGFCGSDHALIQSGELADGSILGHEDSGRVAACGKAVSDVAVGQRVIVRPSHCGDCRDCRSGRPYFCQVSRRTIGIGDMPGAFAEYVHVLPSMLIPVPDGVDSSNAALAEAFAASLHGIHCVGRPNGSALVMGGGTIGLALVRLLTLMDFNPIVLSEPVAVKRELGIAFGAHAVMDPLTEETGPRVFELTAGQGFDAVYECSGVADNIARNLHLTFDKLNAVVAAGLREQTDALMNATLHQDSSREGPFSLGDHQQTVSVHEDTKKSRCHDGGSGHENGLGSVAYQPMVALHPDGESLPYRGGEQKPPETKYRPEEG